MKIIKFKVWNANKPKEHTSELTLKEMKLFVDGLHRITKPSPSFTERNPALLRNNSHVRKDVRHGERKSDDVYYKWRKRGPIPVPQKIYFEYGFNINNAVMFLSLYYIVGWSDVYPEESIAFRVQKELARQLGMPFYVVWIETEEENLGDAAKLFSAWHRNAGGYDGKKYYEELHAPDRRAYFTDIDGLEYSLSEDEIITFLATYDLKEWHVTQNRYLEGNANFRAQREFAMRLRIPFYIIWIRMSQVEKPDNDWIRKYKLPKTQYILPMDSLIVPRRI